LHDKDIASTLAELSSCARYWYPASLEGPRAASAQELCQHLPKNTKPYSNPIEAFAAAIDAAREDEVVLVLGSFFTVGAVLEYWQTRRNNGK
jgi:dihydrofolate synthase/folylpolyglutamate synthase